MGGQGTGDAVDYEDAVDFVNAVSVVFKDDKYTYNEFLGAWKDYRKQRIGIVGVTTRMKDLLKSHEELIVRFNTFLPNRFKIALPLAAKEESPVPKAQLIARMVQLFQEFLEVTITE